MIKIIRAFSSGKQLLLEDPKKLAKYLKLIQETPISYLGVRKAIGYKSILNSQFTFDGFNFELFPPSLRLINRDLRQLNTEEFLAALNSLNNYLQLSKLENPQNEPIFQEFIQSVIHCGTYSQQLITAVHIIVYFDSKITLYSQIAAQLKQQLSDHLPDNNEEEVLKMYWNFLNDYDQQKIEQLIQKQEEESPHVNQFIVHQFEKMVEIMANEVKGYSLTTQVLLIELQARVLRSPYFKPDNQQKIYLMSVLSRQCCEEIERNISKLNHFFLIQYVTIIRFMNQEIGLLSWELILNELLYRDITTMSTQDVIKLLFILTEISRGNDQLYDRLFTKLYNSTHLINQSDLAPLAVLVSQQDTSTQQKLLKRIYTKIDLEQQGPTQIAQIVGAYAEAELLTPVMLNKFLPYFQLKLDQINLDSLSLCYRSLVNLGSPNEYFTKHLNTITISDDIDFDSYFDLFFYMMWFQPKHKLLIEIQKQVLQKNDKEVLKDFISVLASVNPKQKEVVELIPQLKERISEVFAEHQTDEQQQQMQLVLAKIYKIK